jgi:hypothetical protein
MKKISLFLGALLASTLSFAAVGDDVPGIYVCKDGQVLGIVIGTDEAGVALFPIDKNACKDKEDTDIRRAVILMQLKLGMYPVPKPKAKPGPEV